MAAPTKKFTPEIDSALYEELEASATQNGQSQRYVLEQALGFYLHTVVPSQHLVRPEVMSTFEESVAGNLDLLEVSPSRIVVLKNAFFARQDGAPRIPLRQDPRWDPPGHQTPRPAGLTENSHDSNLCVIIPG
jgi:hypothetical protein